VERQYELVRDLSNDAIFNDLEWPLIKISIFKGTSLFNAYFFCFLLFERIKM